MTAKAFRDVFQEDLKQKVLMRSVEKGNSCAVSFINGILQKNIKNQGTQSLSIDGIFEDYRNQVAFLDKKLAAAHINEKNMMSELDRLMEKC